MKSKVIILLIFATFLSCKVFKSNYSYSNIPVYGQPNCIDSSIFYWLKPYKDSLNLLMATAVGYNDTPLQKGAPISLLGNWCTDACITFFENLTPPSDTLSHFDKYNSIILLNSGGLRTLLPKGPISIGHLYELMPFDNEMVKLMIHDSSTLDSLCRLIVSRNEPIGNGIIKIKNNQYHLFVQNQLINKNNPVIIYTSDYIANGGDHFELLKNIPKINTTYLLRDIFIQSCTYQSKKYGSLKVSYEQRIILE